MATFTININETEEPLFVISNVTGTSDFKCFDIITMNSATLNIPYVIHAECRTLRDSTLTVSNIEGADIIGDMNGIGLGGALTGEGISEYNNDGIIEVVGQKNVCINVQATATAGVNIEGELYEESAVGYITIGDNTISVEHILNPGGPTNF